MRLVEFGVNSWDRRHDLGALTWVIALEFWYGKLW